MGEVLVGTCSWTGRTGRPYGGVTGPARPRRRRGRHGPGSGVLLPPLAPVTSPELAVVRFHGRSPAWGTGSKEDRFRYAYSESEPAAWALRLRQAADQVDELHVLFNNCCADAAVRAARTMRRVLDTR